MYCKNCGAELNGSEECPKCGFVNVKSEKSSDNVIELTDEEKKKVKKFSVIIVVIIGIFFLMFGSIFLVVFVSLNSVFKKNSTKEYIELNNVEIASYYKVTGDKESLCHVSSSKDLKKFGYCKPLSEENVKQYAEYLLDNGYENSDGGYMYSLKYETEDYTIYVNMDLSTLSYQYVDN